MTATVGIANGDRLVLVDADGNKIAGSGLTFGASTATSSVLSQAGTWVAMYTHPTSDGNKHVPATGTSNGGKFLQAGSTAGTFNWVALTHTVSGTPSASRTITSFTQSNGAITVSFSDIAINASQVSGLPTSLPPTSHTHGNITNDGKIGTTSVADYVVVTTTNGALTTISLTTSDPAASGTATKFISGISQSSNGKISATKASLPSASTSTAGIIKIGTTANDAAAGNHTHDTVYVKKAGDAMTGRLIMNSGIPVNQILTGSGTAATTSGSNYYPAKWTFNTGITVTDGDIYTIKVPVAGHDYGVFMTVDGTNYYPVVLNSTNRITTQYPVNNYIQVVFEASGSASQVFPVAGGTSRVNPSGGVFRVINYYDSGNSGIYQNYNAKAFKVGSTAITQYDLVAEDATGLLVPAHKIAHRVGSPIYITDAAYAANATSSWKGLYDRHYNYPLRNSGTALSMTNYNPVFLKGTIANGMFTPDTTTPYVFTKANCNVSGAYYMYVGDATTTAGYIAFNNIHPYYYYDGTNLVSYTERAGVTDWSNITNKPSSFTPASHNHDSVYLKLAGGTMTGTLSLKANQYEGNYAMNANNSDIIGINRLAFADAADGAREGIDFYRDSTHWDSLWANGGNLYFTPNRPDTTNTTTANSNIILHTGNYTSYAIPKSIGTAAGDIIYFTASGTPARLGKGTDGQVLKSTSSGIAWGSDSNTDTKVTNTLSTTTKYYVTGQTSSTTTTGTQVFDTGVYVTTTSGELNAIQYRLNEKAYMHYDTTDDVIAFTFV